MDVDLTQLLADLLGVDRTELEVGLPDGLYRPVSHQLPVAAGAWFAAGQPVEVAIAVGPRGVTVAVPKVEWHGHSPVLVAGSSEQQAFDDPLMPWLLEAMVTARALRRIAFDACVDCGKENPPEWLGRMDEGPVCHRCMEQNHGVVF